MGVEVPTRVCRHYLSPHIVHLSDACDREAQEVDLQYARCTDDISPLRVLDVQRQESVVAHFNIG